MPSRRALVWVLAALVIALGALSAATRDRSKTATSTTSQTTTAPATGTSSTATTTTSPTGGPEVTGVLPDDKVVKGRVGDLIVIRVRSETPDIAKIAALGVEGAVGPGIAGLLSFQAGQPGRFPVGLTVSERRVGAVEIAPAG